LFNQRIEDVSMENLFIDATPSTPEVDFRFDERVLTLKGESYPENAAAFYGLILERVKRFLATCQNVPITVNVSLAYFNSSSTKLLFSMFEALNQAAKAGNLVTLNWYHDADDDTLYDFGQEIQHDYSALSFNDIPVSTD
jgi:hypothetical protein